MQRIVMTDRLFLRPMDEDDAALIVAWRNNPEILRWMFAQERLTVGSHVAWFRATRNKRVDYMICLKEDGRPIGELNFMNIDSDQHEAEAGKMIGDPSVAGKGYASEAFRAWLRFGFNEIGLTTIRIRTLATNQRNICLNERCGFQVERVERNGYSRGDEQFDVMVMTIKKDDLQ